MKVGYCVPVMPELASYRLRVAIPSQHLGLPYSIGTTGKPTFFFKNGNVRMAEALQSVVYDVVNDHFKGKHAADYHDMCSIADKITVSSLVMKQIVQHNTGRDDAVIIDDPYENHESPASVIGNDVLWFGHSANLSSLIPLMPLVTTICSNWSGATVKWSLEAEAKCLSNAAVVLMTGNNPGASANRVVKAIRAGRFVVANAACPWSWHELKDFMWIPDGFTGDEQSGIEWALNNREEACYKIQQGQKYVAQRFAPQLIGSQWTELFAST